MARDTHRGHLSVGGWPGMPEGMTSDRRLEKQQESCRIASSPPRYVYLWSFSFYTFSPSALLPWWLSGKESACQCRRPGFDPWVRKSPWRRKWQPTPVFLPGKSHGERSLAGYSPWGHKESDITEHLNTHTHFLLQSDIRSTQCAVLLTVFLEFPSSCLYTVPPHSFQ